MSREELNRIRKELTAKERTLEKLQIRLSEISSERVALKNENKVLQTQVNQLQNEKQSLLEKVKVLEVKRPVLKPPRLVTGFYESLEKMQESLKVPETGLNYVISNFDVSLKTNLTLDEEGELAFQLPEIGEKVPSDALSTINFNIKAAPKPPRVRTDRVEIPNLVGYMIREAEEKIKQKGFRVGTVSETASRSAPGIVINQSPEAYANAPTGYKIDLWVSRTSTTTCPNLIGLDRETAIRQLEVTDLRVGKVKEQTSKTEPGIVITQNPQPGTELEKNRAVDFVISRKPGATVPNLVGKNMDTVEAILDNAGLTLGEVVYRRSNRDSGTVLGQSPKANIIVEPDTELDLEVALGNLVKVPDLLNQDRDRAESLLKEHKLDIGQVTLKPSGRESGTVLDQSPRPGSTAPPGTGVDLVVASDRVNNISGIGTVTANKLRRIGITGIKTLADADTESVKRVTRGETEKIIEEARSVIMEEELTPIMGKTAAKLVYNSTGIYSREKLMQSKPKELLDKMRENIDEELEETLNLDLVKRWVRGAEG